MDRPPSPLLGAPLVEEVLGLTAWDVCRRFASEPHLIFFDSALASTQGRYSYVSASPLTWIESFHGNILSNNRTMKGDPFAFVKRRLGDARMEAIAGLPPFQGGWAGLFGYDLCHHLERVPRPTFDDFQVPELGVGLYDWVFAFDHVQERGWLIATGLPEIEPAARLIRARRTLEHLRRTLDGQPPTAAQLSSERCPLRSPQYAVQGASRLTSNFDHAGYLGVLRRAIDYIHAGDCFQVNLAQRLLHPLFAPPLEIYGRLRTRNAAPFAGYLDLGNFVIASASPERFLQLADGAVETRPIKGTRPRGVYPMEDMNRSEDLRESLKDRAENIMIVDLLRNDLGRVCQYGSIDVSAVCHLETFRYVHHLVSEIRGRLRPGLDAVDLLRATFPGGSVTGAPKIRAMEIISELERTTRGPYCGCLGYLGLDGGMDMNLLIRTFVLGKGWMQLSVGGGIVADSNPEREYEETWHKAAGMLRAIE